MPTSSTQDDRIAAVGPRLDVPEGTVEIDGVRRHRDAGDDRHPPAHVADRSARLRRRLDPDAVLRLLLPRARQALPPRGHPRRQPAGGGRGDRRGRHHLRGLVAQQPHHRPRRRGGRRPAGDPGPVRVRLRQHPGAAVGVEHDPGVPRLRQPPDHRRRHARLPDRLRHPGRPELPGAGGVRGRARPRRTGDHARRRLGRHQRRRHPADARARLHDAGVDLRARGDADRGLLPADRGDRRLGLGGDRERAERRAGLPAHLGDPQARHPGLAVDGHERLVERRPVLRDAVHAGGGPLARAPRGARQRRHGDEPRAPRRPGRRLGHPRRGQGARPRRLAGQRRGRQEGRPGAAQERRVAGLVPDPQPLRSRRLPGPARRRAHGAGRRPGREARRRAGRRGPGRDPQQGGRDPRLPELDDGRRRLAAGHAPRRARGRAGREPVPVQRVPRRRSARARVEA